MTTRKERIPVASHLFAMSEADRLRARRHLERLVAWKRRSVALLRSDPESSARTIGIVGAGLMGTAIAAVHTRHGLSTVLADVDHRAVEKAPQQILASLKLQPTCSSPQSAERLSQPNEATIAERIRCTTDLGELARCDLVLESIVEKPETKRALYAELEPLLAESTVLASNTSTIPIGRLASELEHPKHFCGIHFFHPVGQRPLVEIIKGETTAPTTVHKALSYARSIGKLPIVVDDGPGFLVNRLLLPWLTEALELLLEGATVESIEQAALNFGMAKGPLKLLDEIGLDTALAGGRVLWEAFPERIVASPLLITMVKRGRLGSKSGAGFYEYPPTPTVPQPTDPVGSHAAEADRPVAAETLELIAQWAGKPRSHDSHELATRMFLPMIVEATRALSEGIASEVRDVDLGVLFGLGFPADRGGLLFWADQLGPEQLVGMLEQRASLGPRFEPTPWLRRLAADGGRFYD